MSTKDTVNLNINLMDTKINCSLEYAENEYIAKVHAQDQGINLEGNLILKCETKTQCEDFVVSFLKAITKKN